ncbi:hypothetical protein GmRootV213_25190 [Variovorax sp. V213]
MGRFVTVSVVALVDVSTTGVAEEADRIVKPYWLAPVLFQTKVALRLANLVPGDGLMRDAGCPSGGAGLLADADVPANVGLAPCARAPPPASPPDQTRNTRDA